MPHSLCNPIVVERVDCLGIRFASRLDDVEPARLAHAAAVVLVRFKLAWPQLGEGDAVVAANMLFILQLCVGIYSKKPFGNIVGGSTQVILGCDKNLPCLLLAQ